MTGPAVQVEATGETVGEARWAALHELERRYPTLDRAAVEFVVLSEGRRGLLGVGYEPARVMASLAGAPAPSEAAAAPPAVSHPEDSPAAARLREFLGQIVTGLGLDATVTVRHSGETLEGTVAGDDLGLLIGRHGHTIDAVQYLANAVMHRREPEPVEVVVDAQGYRARRERTLRDVAARAAAEAIRSGGPVPLEPMTSVERKIIHVYLKAEVPRVRTASEGTEPNRHVVVLPAADAAEVGQPPEV
jgi:spoIIIJ-associated protein